MTKQEIISDLCAQHTIEKMITTYTNGTADFAEDLAQDVYCNLLEKDDALIEGLYKKNQLGFFLLRIVRNNLFSSTSPYYSKYMKYQSSASDITASEYKIASDEYEY